jgi:hypothetical protein
MFARSGKIFWRCPIRRRGDANRPQTPRIDDDGRERGDRGVTATAYSIPVLVVPVNELEARSSDGRVSSLTELSSAVLRAWQRRLYVTIEGDFDQLGAGRGPGRRRASPPSFKRSAFQRLRFRRRPPRRRTRHDRAHCVGDSACTRDCGRSARSHPVGPLDAANPLSTSRGHQGKGEQFVALRPMRAQARVVLVDALRDAHHWLDD